MQKNLIVVLIVSLFIGMGCSGAEGPLGSPVGTGTGPDGGSTPVFAPGGGGDVDVNDDGGATPAAPAAKPPANPPPGKPKAPSIECFEKIFPEGSVGAPYTHTLEASEGTPPFQYALKNGAELPEGLALSADGAISGTPEEAGNFKPKVVVTDGGEKKKECKTEIVVKGDLGINVTVVEGAGAEPRWDAVYAIAVSGGGEDVVWAWEDDLDNVCMSSTAPDVLTPDFRDECTAGSKIASGGSAFLWLKADRQGAEALSLTLTVTSEYAKAPTSHDFEFEYTPNPVCGNDIKEGLEACDGTDVTPGFSCKDDCTGETRNPTPAVFAQVETWTGGGGYYSDTDSSISIRFCKDKGMTDCTQSIPLDDPKDDDDRQLGDADRISISANGLGMTDEHRYFQIAHDGGGSNWMLQGIRVTIGYGDEFSSHQYVYFNPCVEKWTNEGDRLPFGPNDTAACAIVETGTVKNAGTNDRILLVFENFDVAAADEGLVDTSLSSWSPHFIGGRNDDGYLMKLGWYCPAYSSGTDACNDFENGDKASYGDYLFDVKPYSKAPKFHFEKEGGDWWYLEGYEIFVFQPARTFSGGDQAPDPIVYHKKAMYNNWFGDTTLIGSSDTLEKADWSVITWDIGQHWED